MKSTSKAAWARGGFSLGLCVLLGSCNPLAGGGTASGAGKCETDSGVVNTYNIFGGWKKITGYETARTKAELELNYDVLIVEAGTPFCYVRVENMAATDTTVRGTYTHDITDKSFVFDYLTGENAPQTLSGRYSFSGSCDKTIMTLTYDDGPPEKYQLYNNDLSQVSCTPPSN